MDDFFVETNECMFCGAPPAAAPNLMGMRIGDTGYEECYFRRQPTNDAEVDEAIAGMSASCCGAVQYRGSDKRVLIKISRSDTYPFLRPSVGAITVKAAMNRPIVSEPETGFIARLLKRFR